MKKITKYFKHKTAEIAKTASIGEGTKIWNNCQICRNAVIGRNCTLGKNVYIGPEVKIGNNVKIQNNVSIYYGVTVEGGVFIGPHVVFSNDKYPRAINEDNTVKKNGDWKLERTIVKYGSSVGANSTILPGLTIGEYSMVGSGSVVTKDIPDFSLVYGNPAKIQGKVDKKGNIIKSYSRQINSN
jgi:acetyltransferase-like isoleucine patch superfamily enzyme